MASRKSSSRAIAAGLSCGVGLAVPVIAFAATLPFEAPNSLVGAGAVPFAAGALIGVGSFALSSHVLDGRVDDQPEADAPKAEKAKRGRRAAKADGRTTERGGIFSRGRHRADAGVPVIARAQGAPSEADAWAEIDSLLDEDSLISCDPVKSRDIYEVALEELRRESAAAASASSPSASAGAEGSTAAVTTKAAAATVSASAATATATATASAATATATAPTADSTAVFMALAELQSEPAATTGRLERVVSDDTDAARRAALDSLDTLMDENGDIIGRTEYAADPQSVPVADYTGREAVWAAAIAVLEDEIPSAAPTFIGRHSRSAASVTSPSLIPPSAARAQSVDEGARATRMHDRVNALIEEEFDRVPSASVRSMSREYLHVIQGGTASLPRLRAEA